MSVKRALVTGASGHIGFHVSVQLLALGHEVILLIRRENANIQLLKNLGAKIVIADLQDPETYRAHFRHIDVLFHLASENTTSVKNESKIIDNIYNLTRKVFQTAILNKVKLIIYTSSVVVLGRSNDPNVLITEKSYSNKEQQTFESAYVKAKVLAEQYCDQIINHNNLDIRRIYPSLVLGGNNLKITPPQKLVNDFLKKGQWYYFAGGISIADVKSVAKAHIDAWLKGTPSGKYITAGNNITFEEFYNKLAECAGYRKPFIFVPKPLIYFAGLLMENIFGDKSLISSKYISAVIGNYSWYSSAKAQLELGYTIPNLEVILEDAIAEAKKINYI